MYDTPDRVRQLVAAALPIATDTAGADAEVAERTLKELAAMVRQLRSVVR